MCAYIQIAVGIGIIIAHILLKRIIIQPSPQISKK
jgi:hypothetical protein